MKAFKGHVKSLSKGFPMDCANELDTSSIPFDHSHSTRIIPKSSVCVADREASIIRIDGTQVRIQHAFVVAWRDIKTPKRLTALRSPLGPCIYRALYIGTVYIYIYSLAQLA